MRHVTIRNSSEGKRGTRVKWSIASVEFRFKSLVYT